MRGKLKSLGSIFSNLGKLLKRKKLRRRVRVNVDTKKPVQTKLPPNRKVSASGYPDKKPDFDQVYNRAPAAKAEIDELAHSIANKNGGFVAEAPIKSKERALEKINADYGSDPSKIKDLARNTIVVPPDKIEAVVQDLRNSGANVKVIDSKLDPLGYSGINTTVNTKAGIPAEIQVNTPEMIFAKEPEVISKRILGDDLCESISKKSPLEGGLGHKYYEAWRTPGLSPDEASDIAKKSKNYYDVFRGI
jgi:subtilisin family serine protease